MKTIRDSKKQARIDNYEAQRAALLERGYTETLVIMSVLKANVLAAAVTLPLIAACAVLYGLVHGGFSLSMSSLFETAESPGALILQLLRVLGIALAPLAAILVLVVVHELLHGLGWVLFCQNGWKSIIIDVMWDKLTPYCHCKEPLAYGPYMLGALAPLVITGFGLFALALSLGHSGLLALSFLGILAAGGDLMIVLMLLRHRKAAYFMDLAADIGCSVFSK